MLLLFLSLLQILSICHAQVLNQGNIFLQVDGKPLVVLDVARAQDSSVLEIVTSEGKHPFSFDSVANARSFEFFIALSNGVLTILPKADSTLSVLVADSNVVFSQAEVLRELKRNETGRNTVLADHLGLNEDNSVRVIARISEAQGIREQIELSKSAASEEAWVYFPEASLWVEIGEIVENAGQVSEGHKSVKLVLAPLFSEVSRKYKEVHFYHIHPQVGVTEAVEAGHRKFDDAAKLSQMSAPMQACQHTILEQYYPIFGALPSVGDILAVTKVEASVQMAFPGAKSRFFVSSPLGVCEYHRVSKLNEPGRLSMQRNWQRSINLWFKKVCDRFMALSDSQRVLTVSEIKDLEIGLESALSCSISRYSPEEVERIPGISDSPSKSNPHSNSGEAK